MKGSPPTCADGQRGIDRCELESAREEPSWETVWYLDLETRQRARVDAQTRREREAISQEGDQAEAGEQPDLAEMRRTRALPAGQQEALAEADEVERGSGGGCTAVPRADSG
jgi:hypothetical protein